MTGLWLIVRVASLSNGPLNSAIVQWPKFDGSKQIRKQYKHCLLYAIV